MSEGLAYELLMKAVEELRRVPGAVLVKQDPRTWKARAAWLKSEPAKG